MKKLNYERIIQYVLILSVVVLLFNNYILTEKMGSILNPNKLINIELKEMELFSYKDSTITKLRFPNKNNYGIIYISKSCSACDNIIEDILNMINNNTELKYYLVSIDGKKEGIPDSLQYFLNKKDKKLVPRIVPKLVLINTKGKIINELNPPFKNIKINVK